jgi:prevent-host-death family protein
MVRIMSVTEAKSQLSALVEDAIRGKETIITKHGKPVARIVPITKPRIVFGLLEGKLPEFDDLDPSEPWLPKEAIGVWRKSLERSGD